MKFFGIRALHEGGDCLFSILGQVIHTGANQKPRPQLLRDDQQLVNVALGIANVNGVGGPIEQCRGLPEIRRFSSQQKLASSEYECGWGLILRSCQWFKNCKQRAVRPQRGQPFPKPSKLNFMTPVRAIVLMPPPRTTKAWLFGQDLRQPRGQSSKIPAMPISPKVRPQKSR